MLSLSSQSGRIEECMSLLKKIQSPEQAEKILIQMFESAPDLLVPDSADYNDMLNFQLYKYIVKSYKKKSDNICLWRFIKNLSCDQLDYEKNADSKLILLDSLIRIYLYSDPLDDLTCIFIPVNNTSVIKKYLSWIKSYFYDVNYPTSLLWLYALDSSLASLLPDEIIFLGKCMDKRPANIMIPDFNDEDTVLIKRFSDVPGHFLQLEGKTANDEFRQIFNFLEREFKDRCLSRSGKLSDYQDKEMYIKEWEKFEDVLRFGVSDAQECGCVSFSDMRASTEFLNTHGKNVFLNKIQQPFFEETKVISNKYQGRIDKFMGDNVMCVFLNPHKNKPSSGQEEKIVLNNFFAIFDLCKILYKLIVTHGLKESKLGLRSGVTYGDQILRSNLGNDFVRDFTVTGETVNLAARLEHISIHELKLHNKMYFQNTIDRFSEISRLVSVCKNENKLNPETFEIIQDFTLYQNIHSNLEKLDKARFDVRFNQRFYLKIREHLKKKGFSVLNSTMSEIHGYEEYDIKGYKVKFYFLYYNPKGFNNFEKIRILPFEPEILENLDIHSVI